VQNTHVEHRSGDVDTVDDVGSADVVLQVSVVAEDVEESVSAAVFLLDAAGVRDGVGAPQLGRVPEDANAHAAPTLGHSATSVGGWKKQLNGV